MSDLDPRTGQDLFEVDNALDKYLLAGEIANSALKQLIPKCTPGANIVQLCVESDAYIKQRCDGSYKKAKDMRKGLSFPTCLSVNEIMGHFSPIESDQVLQKGDVLKIDLGAHIGGYPAWIGHTIIVGEDSSEGRKADVLMAAWTAAEAAIHSIRIGETNYSVTRNLEKAYSTFDCRGVHGVFSHECGRNLVDGGNHIIHNRDLAEERVDEFSFAPYQAFIVQVMASTGPGKAREKETYQSTVYKRDPDNSHPMKTPLTRQFVGELLRQYPVFPFNTRQVVDKKCRTVGVAECTRRYMIQAFPVVVDIPGSYVASFTFTVVIMPNGVKKVSDL